MARGFWSTRMRSARFAGADDAEVDVGLFGALELFGSVEGCGADDFEGREAGFAEEFELLDISEAVGLVDEAGVGTGGDVAACVFEVFEEVFPDAVVPVVGVLVFRGPVVVVGAVVFAVGLVVLHERGERVFVVPLRCVGALEIAACGVDGHGWVEDGAALDPLGDECVPLFAAAGIDLVPVAGDLAEAHLLVVVVLVGGIVLDRGVSFKSDSKRP